MAIRDGAKRKRTRPREVVANTMRLIILDRGSNSRDIKQCPTETVVAASSTRVACVDRAEPAESAATSAPASQSRSLVLQGRYRSAPFAETRLLGRRHAFERRYGIV